MTYDEFISKLESLGYEMPKKKPERYGLRYASGPVLYQNKLAFVNSWHVGGTSGRSCWGGELSSYSTGEPEPEWTELDALLEKFCPNLTFLQYKRLLSKVKNDSEEDGDYYGNTSIYSVRILYLEDLYEFLKERNCLE